MRPPVGLEGPIARQEGGGRSLTAQSLVVSRSWQEFGVSHQEEARALRCMHVYVCIKVHAMLRVGSLLCPNRIESVSRCVHVRACTKVGVGSLLRPSCIESVSRCVHVHACTKEHAMLG